MSSSGKRRSPALLAPQLHLTPVPEVLRKHTVLLDQLLRKRRAEEIDRGEGVLSPTAHAYKVKTIVLDDLPLVKESKVWVGRRKPAVSVKNSLVQRCKVTQSEESKVKVVTLTCTARPQPQREDRAGKRVVRTRLMRRNQAWERVTELAVTPLRRPLLHSPSLSPDNSLPPSQWTHVSFSLPHRRTIYTHRAEAI